MVRLGGRLGVLGERRGQIEGGVQEAKPLRNAKGFGGIAGGLVCCIADESCGRSAHHKLLLQSKNVESD